MRQTRRPVLTGPGPGWLIPVAGLVIIGVVIFIVVACVGPSSGTVYAKNHWPAYNSLERACSSYTDSGSCRSYYTYWQYHPEQFWLCLDNGEDRGCRPVAREQYHSVGVGDYFDHDAAVR